MSEQFTEYIGCWMMCVGVNSIKYEIIVEDNKGKSDQSKYFHGILIHPYKPFLTQKSFLGPFTTQISFKLLVIFWGRNIFISWNFPRNATSKVYTMTEYITRYGFIEWILKIWYRHKPGLPTEKGKINNV